MRKSTLLFFGTLFFKLSFSQQIPATFWGINHWMPKAYVTTPSQPNGQADHLNVQLLTKNAGCTVYRIGGHGYDTLGSAIGNNASNNDYISAIQKVKAANPNAKFLIQVPFKSGIVDSAGAGVLVDNIEAAFPADNFYYAIGNEWDRYIKQSGGKYTTAQMKKIIKSYAFEMKKADNSIKIVAPAVSYYYVRDSGSVNHILTDLIGGSQDITGLISGTGTPADGKYFVDVVDYHTYASGSNGDLSGTNSTNYNAYRDSAINYPKTIFKSELNGLQSRINAANTLNSRTGSNGLTWAITEIHVAYKNPTDTTLGDQYANSPEGLGARSFFAGQYWASMMSAMLKHGTSPANAKCEFVMPWSIHEARGLGGKFDLGMTRDSASSVVDPHPLSTYHHLKLLGTHFYGNYTYGNSNKNKVQSFGSIEPGAGFYIMILNQDAIDYPFDIKFNNTAGTAALQLKYTINPIPDSSLVYNNDTIKANSTVLLQFNCHGRKLTKTVYTLQNAKNNTPPQLKQIGNTDVNPEMAACGMPGIGGTINSNTTYSNTTVYVTSDLLVVGSNKLTFDNAIVVVSPGVKIKSNPNSSIEIKNNTVMFGCDGKQWKGIELNGNYNPGEKLLIENSFIYNARNPVVSDRIADLKIKGSVLANGETAVSLNRSQSFTMTGNLIAGYNTGIKTTNTKPDYISAIKENQFIQMRDGLDFDSDGHNMLDIACNQIAFSGKGILSRNTDLKEQGDASQSAGNTFIKMGPGLPTDYIDHTGTPTKYYFGPAEAAAYLAPYVMNIPKVQALSDKFCTTKVATNCSPFVGIPELGNNIDPQILIYPNPSAGEFTINLSSLSKGKWTLTVYDVMGREITSQKVNADSESAHLQINTKGLYFVCIQEGDKRVTKKVVID